MRFSAAICLRSACLGLVILLLFTACQDEADVTEATQDVPAPTSTPAPVDATLEPTATIETPAESDGEPSDDELENDDKEAKPGKPVLDVPDGIAYIANDRINIVSPDGGNPQLLINKRVLPDGIAWSPNGAALAYLAFRGGGQDVFVMDLTEPGNKAIQITKTPGDERHPAWSPDGTWLAYCADRDGNTDIYVAVAISGDREQRVTWDAGEDCAPAWSLDGTQLAFESNREGNTGIFIMDVPDLMTDITEEPAISVGIVNEYNNYAPAWSPDGSKLAYYSSRGGAYNVFVANPDGSDEVQLTGDDEHNEWWPTWSPDGESIAYSKMDEDSLHDIYMIPASGGTATRLTDNTADNWFPDWKPVPIDPVARGPITVAALAGKPEALDGKFTDWEWTGAIPQEMSDGSTLYLMHEDGYLYLAVEGASMEVMAINVFMLVDDEVRVMHSSAALGTAIFEQDGDRWVRTREFDWKCRDRGQSEAAQAERDAYLDDEGWLANNGFMGKPNIVEYQITVEGDAVMLAVQLMRSSAQDVRHYWPLNLMDDLTVSAAGGSLEMLDLDVDRWARVEIK